MTGASFAVAVRILDAANHRPFGATLVVPEVSWDDYESLLNEFDDRKGLTPGRGQFSDGFCTLSITVTSTVAFAEFTFNPS
jgi:hypothetical protein